MRTLAAVSEGCPSLGTAIMVRQNEMSLYNLIASHIASHPFRICDQEGQKPALGKKTYYMPEPEQVRF